MQTIGEYYSQIDFERYGQSESETLYQNLDLVTYGKWNKNLRKAFEWPGWTDLFLQVIAVAKERGAMPFLAETTCWQVMDSAKSRYLKSKSSGRWIGGARTGHWELINPKLAVPGCWLAIITDLKEAAKVSTQV